jgi:hypothetical protein
MFFLNLFIVGVYKVFLFSKLILYLAIYGVQEFLARVFGSLRYRIMLSGNRDSLTIS